MIDQHHIRAAERTLERIGVARDNMLAHPYVDDKERYTAWLADSFLYAVKELERPRGDSFRVVVRCYGQCREYGGRLQWLTADLADMVRALQVEVERMVGEPTQ